MIRCGGCGDQVNLRCKDHPNETLVKDSKSLYYICNGGHMPHYAICENPHGLPPHFLFEKLW